MRVGDLNEIVRTLRKQGHTITSPDELVPKYLGKGGFVGCEVGKGKRQETIWVIGVNVVRLGGQAPKSEAAEWLTMALVDAGGELPVADLMKRYLERYSFNMYGTSRLETLSMLAYIADYMGFTEDVRASVMRLPADHPLADMVGGV